MHDITSDIDTEAKSHENQELLSLALEIGEVGTFRRDYVSGLIYCGEKTRRMNALPPGDRPIPAERWLETLVPEDVDRLMQDVAQTFARQSTTLSLQYRFIHPEKGIRHAETRSRVEYNSTGVAVSSMGVVIDVTERCRTESRLVHLSHHDPLTDLPNRSLFHIRLREALKRAAEGQRSAIFCLDLDSFKDVNDTLGHAGGDFLLQKVANRLHAVSRRTDTIARLGGDEFAIIYSQMGDVSDVSQFASRILDVLCRPYEIDGQIISVSASIGIAIAPDDGLDASRLLRNADIALYAAKNAGRSCYKRFEPVMDERLQALRAFDGRLRQALADGALELFYQPIVSLTTHRISGFEALLRWRHPERGLVLPDEFIPLAEANGHIGQIGVFILHQACAEAATWSGCPNVAVNISATEFARPDLVDIVSSALSKAELEPSRLELEITERTMLHDNEATIGTLRKLKALGVKISIDDFGTGFSSLAYLQHFAFDKVKIDRSFIGLVEVSTRSQAIVRAIVSLCVDLNIQTVAEGIETASQLSILSRMGCTEAQGFHFSRPRPAGEIENFILEFQRSCTAEVGRSEVEGIGAQL